MATEKYLLKQELKAHDRGVRCVLVLDDGAILISGGFDGCVSLWQRTGQSATTAYSLLRQFNVLVNKTVYALSVSDDSDAAGRVTFYCGGGDGSARRYTLQGDVVQQFKVVDCPVVSIVEVSAGTKHEEGQAQPFKPLVVTGSWDGTARVWDRLSGLCVKVLEGHKHAVCVGLLPPPATNRTTAPLSEYKLLTGSQDGLLRLWSLSQFSQASFCSDAHTGIIRNIVALPGGSHVATSSNDGSVAVWEVSHSTVERVKSLKAHASFVYDVSVNAKPSASSPIDVIVVTASEDMTAAVWDFKTGEEVQSIKHSSSVWQTACLATSLGTQLPRELVTCCGDGYLRLWTTEHEMAADEGLREAQIASARMAHEEAAKKSETAIDVSKLRDATQAHTLQGQRVGQTVLFKEGDLAVAYQWNGTGWERIGEMVGSEDENSNAGGVLYEGDGLFEAGLYDFVFDVEIGEGGAYKKLPYRKGQNPLEVAETFVARENIGRAAVNDVANFLRANGGGGTTQQPAPRALAPTALTSGCSTSDLSSATVETTKHFPINSYVLFDNVKTEMIKKKIQEINTTKYRSDEELRLTAAELSDLDHIFANLSKPRRQWEDLSQREQDIVWKKKLIHWPPPECLPVMDLWRVVQLHTQSTRLYTSTDQGAALIHHALRVIEDSKSTDPCRLSAVRFMCNMFEFASPLAAITKRRERILSKIASLAASSNENLQLSVATLLLNFSVAYHMKSSAEPVADTVEGREQVVALAVEVLSTANCSVEAFYRCLVAVGCCLVPTYRGEAVDTLVCQARASGIHLLPPNNRTDLAGSPKVVEALHELRTVVQPSNLVSASSS